MFGSAGEYVAAEKIEAAYKKNSLVDQIWVYGNSLESTLVAIVVPAGTHSAHHVLLSYLPVSCHCTASMHAMDDACTYFSPTLPVEKLFQEAIWCKPFLRPLGVTMVDPMCSRLYGHCKLHYK